MNEKSLIEALLAPLTPEEKIARSRKAREEEEEENERKREEEREEELARYHDSRYDR
jgi:ribosomal protein L12E/L44/L45/RPP1/RPP2